MVEYYFKIFNALKERIPSLYETATSHYIALRCAETSKNIAEIHIQNSKRKILNLLCLVNMILVKNYQIIIYGL